MEPAVSQDAVLLRSEPMPDDAVTVQGSAAGDSVIVQLLSQDTVRIRLQ